MPCSMAWAHALCIAKPFRMATGRVQDEWSTADLHPNPTKNPHLNLDSGENPSLSPNLTGTQNSTGDLRPEYTEAAACDGAHLHDGDEHGVVRGHSGAARPMADGQRTTRAAG